jgi:hypothetical protein
MALQHPLIGIIQVLALALAVPFLGKFALVWVTALLMLLHASRLSELVSAFSRTRWLLLALLVASLLPTIVAGQTLSLLSLIEAGARLLPIVLLITAVTVWVSPHPGPALSAAITKSLRPLRFAGVDPSRSAVILAGTLAAIPSTLERVRSVRTGDMDYLDAVATLVRHAERAEDHSFSDPVALNPISAVDLLLFSAWIGVVVTAQIAGS